MQQEDIYLHTYQDDFDTDDDATDPIIDEETDDPLEILHVPAEEFKEGIDSIALDDLERGHEDMRETIEDQDEDMGQGGK
jgi:hypothetical protein